MARIRTVKPELFKHEDLFDLEKATGLPIRVAFMGLFTCSDRDGRFKWRPRTLKLDVLPHDEVDFSRVLDALMTRDFVRKYEIDGEVYGVIPTFYRHQVINNRESESEIPAPTESSYISMTSTRAARVDDATITPLVHAQVEGKGREGNGNGKGKEGEGDKSTVAAATGDLLPIPETTEEIKARLQASLIVDAILPARGDAGADVRLVFTYWQQVTGHKKAKLDVTRERVIKARIKDGYSPEDLCRAVDGCMLSPYHMGKNDTQTIHDDIELICRNAPHVDKFLALCQRQAGRPAGPIGDETMAQKNARITAAFLGEPEPDIQDLNTIDMESDYA